MSKLDLEMALVENYVLEERVIKNITREIILDLRPKNIKKVFHLPRAYRYIRLTYHQAKRWYREDGEEAS